MCDFAWVVGRLDVRGSFVQAEFSVRSSKVAEMPTKAGAAFLVIAYSC